MIVMDGEKELGNLCYLHNLMMMIYILLEFILYEFLLIVTITLCIYTHDQQPSS